MTQTIHSTVRFSGRLNNLPLSSDFFRKCSRPYQSGGRRYFRRMHLGLSFLASDAMPADRHLLFVKPRFVRPNTDRSRLAIRGGGASCNHERHGFSRSPSGGNASFGRDARASVPYRPPIKQEIDLASRTALAAVTISPGRCPGLTPNGTDLSWNLSVLRLCHPRDFNDFRCVARMAGPKHG